MSPVCVSIVTPFFRAGEYLDEAIESVFAQRNFDDWHLYLVNDGSDDCDVSIAKDFSQRYPQKVTLLEHEGCARRGTSASRNLAIRKSGGEFIAFLDADDVWLPGKLAFQVAKLREFPEAGMMFGAAQRWYSWDGGTDLSVPATVDGFGSDCVVPGSALLSTYLRDESLTPCTGSVLIRRAAVPPTGFEEQFPGLYDDQVFYAKVCAANRILVSSECVSRYRQHFRSCCRQAESQDLGPAERARFLAWLTTFQEEHSREITDLAVPSRE